MNPSFQLIDSGWDQVIGDAVATECAVLRVVCPFIKERTVRRLLASRRPELIQVITRFHLGEMCDGVNDTAALRLLLEHGAQVRGIKGLHAKLYLFGAERVIVTSANLTEAALLRNHEFGFVSTQPEVIQHCREYFETLWKRAGHDLDLARLEGWESKIKAVQVTGSRPSHHASLEDEGTATMVETSFGFAPSVAYPTSQTEAQQAFVKFFGLGDDRIEWTRPVLEEVKDVGCHWACTYPASKRPRSVSDGAVMFMAHFVENPHDTLIYGRATAMRHVDKRDVASQEEIDARSLKADWPMYVRVHGAEFVAGIVGNGIRLSELIDALGTDAFASTQRNARAGSGNLNPRASLRQQPAVALTQEAYHWLNERMEAAFALHGKLTRAELESLDWPDLPLLRFEAYQDWLQKTEGLKPNTAREYAYFLTRCSTHYDVAINETAVPDEETANRILEQIRQVVGERGRWADGTFDERDVRQNLSPALRAFGRYSRSLRQTSVRP